MAPEAQYPTQLQQALNVLQYLVYDKGKSPTKVRRLAQVFDGRARLIGTSRSFYAGTQLGETSSWDYFRICYIRILCSRR